MFTIQCSFWRVVWLFLAAFAITELVASFLFWAYVMQSGVSAQPFSHSGVAVLIAVASLWSYAACAFVLIWLQRAPGVRSQPKR